MGYGRFKQKIFSSLRPLAQTGLTHLPSQSGHGYRYSIGSVFRKENVCKISFDKSRPSYWSLAAGPARPGAGPLGPRSPGGGSRALDLGDAVHRLRRLGLCRLSPQRAGSRGGATGCTPDNINTFLYWNDIHPTVRRSNSDPGRPPSRGLFRSGISGYAERRPARGESELRGVIQNALVKGEKVEVR
jgi:hypothetical protein